jgi:hypothetical protein
VPGHDPKPIASTNLPRARDPQYREIYSNASQTQLGPFDITLNFQRNAEITPGQLAAVDQVSVTFSPQHFKALLNSLNETLKAYETLYGELNIPTEETAPGSDAAAIVGILRAAKNRATAENATSSSAPPQPSSRPRGASPEKGQKP